MHWQVARAAASRHSVRVAKRGSLVSQVLERVSGGLFESHPALVRAYAQGQPGVHALYEAREGHAPRLYYVGLASDLRRRLKPRSVSRRLASGFSAGVNSDSSSGSKAMASTACCRRPC